MGQGEGVQESKGRDVVVLSGTGSGKSLVFQIPALLTPRAVTIIVSPLIALMRDPSW